MLKTLFVLALLVAQLRASDQMRVSRLYVNTPHDTNIIYMYAGAAFPEGEPLKDEAVKCFVSELKATGLFTDVRVALKPTEDGQTVDVVIKPTWHPRKDYFTISEIALEGLTSLDEQKLRANLLPKGIKEGSLLPGDPILHIREAVKETIHEMYQADPEKESDVMEEMFYLSLGIKLAGPERIKLVIAPGLKHLCQQQSSQDVPSARPER